MEMSIVEDRLDYLHSRCPTDSSLLYTHWKFLLAARHSFPDLVVVFNRLNNPPGPRSFSERWNVANITDGSSLSIRLPVCSSRKFQEAKRARIVYIVWVLAVKSVTVMPGKDNWAAASQIIATWSHSWCTRRRFTLSLAICRTSAGVHECIIGSVTATR